jgi:uncharacterized protein YukE
VSGLTLAQVRSWRPAALSAAGVDVGRASGRLDREVSSVTGAIRAARGSWTGPAAEAAADRASREAATGRSLVEALESARRALDSGAAEIGSARTHVLSVVADAEASGFRVGEDGSVTAPTLPPVMTTPEQATEAARERDARQQELNTEAQVIADSIGRGLGQVADADGRTAGALTSIEVPAALEAEVNAFIDRLRTSGDLAAALGAYGAGGVALTQALIKASGMFNKSRAYASWLTMTGRQLRSAGGASRFMTGAGGNAGAYQQFVRAMAGSDDAMRMFQTGQANGGMLRFLMGSRAARLAGRAFLPLTVVTGVADTFTGGGYDGARGWATRGFGLAGAAGAGTMLAMSAGVLASNPIGWGIAGAAVLGYGAWSLGNLAWDNREEIGQFLSDSASWVGDRATEAWNATGDAVSSATDWAGDRLDDAADAAKDFGEDALDVVSFGLL